MSKDQNSGIKQASAQMDSVIALVVALDVDYSRLEELRNGAEYCQSRIAALVIECDGFEDDCRELAALREEAKELAKLESEAGDNDDEDSAIEALEADALSVEYRSGWTSLRDAFEPEEFRIVLCTGGPHVEIRGEVNQHGEPKNCGLFYSDWGQGMTEYHGDNLDCDALQRYAARFVFPM